MVRFREELAELKRTEDDPHWRDIDPDELTEFDQNTWVLFRSGLLSVEHFKERRAVVSRDHVVPQGRKDSRHNFYAYVGNKVSEREAQRIMAEMDAEEQAQK